MLGRQGRVDYVITTVDWAQQTSSYPRRCCCCCMRRCCGHVCGHGGQAPSKAPPHVLLHESVVWISSTGWALGYKEVAVQGSTVRCGALSHLACPASGPRSRHAAVAAVRAARCSLLARAPAAHTLWTLQRLLLALVWCCYSCSVPPSTAYSRVSAALRHLIRTARVVATPAPASCSPPLMGVLGLRLLGLHSKYGRRRPVAGALRLFAFANANACGLWPSWLCARVHGVHHRCAAASLRDQRAGKPQADGEGSESHRQRLTACRGRQKSGVQGCHVGAFISHAKMRTCMPPCVARCD